MSFVIYQMLIFSKSLKITMIFFNVLNTLQNIVIISGCWAATTVNPYQLIPMQFADQGVKLKCAKFVYLNL